MNHRPPSRCLLTMLLLGVLAGCAREPGEEQKRADADYARAKSALAQGAFATADSALREAVAIDRRLGRASLVAEELRQLAAMYADAARFDDAVILYQESLEQFKGLADRATAREVTLEMAALYRRMGEEKKAWATYTEALRFARVFNDTDGALDVQWAMLPAARALGEFAEASRAEEELLKAYTASGDVARQARVYFQMGLSGSARAAYAPAAQHLLSALALAEQAHDSLLAATVLLRLAMAYHAAGNDRASFEAYTNGLRRADLLRDGHPLRLEMLMRIGNIYLQTGQLQEATRFYRAALVSAVRTGNRLAEGYLWIQLGHCDRGPGKDLEAFRAASDLFAGVHAARGEAYALRCQARAQLRLRQTAEALHLYAAAVDAGERSLQQVPDDDLYAECEQAAFGLPAGPCYDDLIEALLQINRSLDAFMTLERKNNRGLSAVASLLEPRTGNGQLNVLLSDCAHWRAVRVGAERQVERLLENAPRNQEYLRQAQEAAAAAIRKHQEHGATIAETARIFGPVAGTVRTDREQVQRSLPAGVALVEYAPTRRSVYAFVMTREHLAVSVAAVERARLAAAAGELAELLRREERPADSLKGRTRSSERTAELSAQLFEAFIRPIERECAGMDEIMVVYPRDIALVPLHALRRTRGSAYVAEQHLVSYLPSSALLTAGSPPATPVKEVVAVGFAGSTGWDVEYELRDIRAFFKDARIYFGPQASLPTLLKERADLVTIAAELSFPPHAPANASLVLSDGRSPAGPRPTPFGELFSLPPFPTILLSDLAGGRMGIDPAEPYVFLANGTTTVILNAYPLSRKTKKYFGEQFYTALLSGSGSRAAFRKAQMEMIRAADFTAPHAWGGFFLWRR